MIKFEELGLSDSIIDVLKKQRIIEPTPIQEESIMLIKSGNDVIAEAQT